MSSEEKKMLEGIRVQNERIEKQNALIISLLTKDTTGLGSKTERVSTHSHSRSKKPDLRKLEVKLREQLFNH